MASLSSLSGGVASKQQPTPQNSQASPSTLKDPIRRQRKQLISRQRQPNTSIRAGPLPNKTLPPPEKEEDAFEFYWTRPLGCPESCRRFTIVRRNNTKKKVSCWALPLRSWNALSHALTIPERGGAPLYTMELQADEEDTWHVFVQSPIWKLWIRRLQQQHYMSLHHVVFLPPKTTQSTTTAVSDVKLKHHHREDWACSLLQDLFVDGEDHLNKRMMGLKKVEFVDQACVEQMRNRLEWLLSLSSSARNIALESICWDAGYSIANKGSALMIASDENEEMLLGKLWTRLVHQLRQSLHTLRLQGGVWHDCFAEEEQQQQFCRTLEALPFLETLDLDDATWLLEEQKSDSLCSGESNGEEEADAGDTAEEEETSFSYLQFLTRLHGLQRLFRQYHYFYHTTTNRRRRYDSQPLHLLREGPTKKLPKKAPAQQREELQPPPLGEDCASAALHVVETWYRDTHRPTSMSKSCRRGGHNDLPKKKKAPPPLVPVNRPAVVAMETTPPRRVLSLAQMLHNIRQANEEALEAFDPAPSERARRFSQWRQPAAATEW